MLAVVDSFGGVQRKKISIFCSEFRQLEDTSENTLWNSYNTVHEDNYFIFEKINNKME